MARRRRHHQYLNRHRRHPPRIHPSCASGHKSMLVRRQKRKETDQKNQTQKIVADIGATLEAGFLAAAFLAGFLAAAFLTDSFFAAGLAAFFGDD
jgi:hypothetical protein